MLDVYSVKQLVTQDESPILEYKKQWYWDDETPKTEMSDKWGEFIKDIISLSNGYLDFVGKTRYLIIGYCESDLLFHNVDIEKIKKLRNLKTFKNELITKLEKYTSPTFLNFDVNLVSVDNKAILIFKIPSPYYMTELKAELKTKTRVLDAGLVLVRKGQKSDEVRSAAPKEFKLLDEEFEKYRNQKIISPIENKVTPIIRSIENTVQLYINKNSSYSLDEGYPISIKNWQDNIIFEVFKISETLGESREFLYIHENSNQGKTYAYIKSNNLIKNISKVIILTEKPQLKDVSKRKINIKSIFKNEYVFFIDEFGYEFLYKDCFLDYVKYNLPVYVDSLYDDDTSEDNSAFEKLSDWYLLEDQPLFVIKGHGGIGKTTLVKQFLDHIYDENNDTGILFIDSNEIIDELSKKSTSNKKIKDIYDFYEAQVAGSDNKISKFSKDLLKLSVDNGSLIIVLDGIDEVIAKLGDKFDLKSFIKSITKGYSSVLKKAKILITCRDHFWSESIKIPEITLKPFNSKLTNEFFIQALCSVDSKVTKALSIANDFAIDKDSLNDEDPVYIPYLLDMIAYLVKAKSDTFASKPINNSYILSKEIHVDFLIASICEREIKKLDSLCLDEQLKLFMKMSVGKDAGISLYDIKNVLNLVTDINVDTDLIEKLKGHPLLVCNDRDITFRYDVFNTYFKSLHVAVLLNSKKIDLIENDSYKIISGYIKYNNTFTQSICERIHYNDDLILYVMEVIEHIDNDESLDDDYKKSIISGMFVLLLCAMQHSGEVQSNIETRTDLMIKLFEVSKTISNFNLINLFGNDSVKAIFDFKNKTFFNCCFDNYEYFWDCPMDDKTKFLNSTFKNLEPRKGVRPVFFDGTFDPSCQTSDISHLIKERKDEVESKANRLTEDLVKFFRIFYERGNFYPRKQEQVRSKLSATKFLSDLISLNVVSIFHDPKKPTMKQYKIADEYRTIINYIEQGGGCLELEKLVKKLISD